MAPAIHVLARIEPDPFGGCWLWPGAGTGGGYGQVTECINGVKRPLLVHRVMYEHLVGPIPQGLWIDHLCRVRCCCNPAHMEPVTPKVNTLRSPVAPAAVNSRKAVCSKGHPFSPENTFMANGKRGCIICRRAHGRANMAAWRVDNLELSRQRVRAAQAKAKARKEAAK